MNALAAVMTREAKIRATNLLFIFWDLLYPLGYLLVFGVGINASLGFSTGDTSVSYNAFFLAGVLSMASFGIASIGTNRRRSTANSARMRPSPAWTRVRTGGW